MHRSEGFSGVGVSDIRVLNSRSTPLVAPLVAVVRLV